MPTCVCVPVCVCVCVCVCARAFSLCISRVFVLLPSRVIVCKLAAYREQSLQSVEIKPWSILNRPTFEMTAKMNETCMQSLCPLPY